MVAVLEEGGTKVVQGRNAVLNNRREPMAGGSL